MNSIVDFLPDSIGSNDNAEISNIESILYRHSPGKVVISNRNFDRASSVIIGEDGVTITNQLASSGLSVKESVNFLGTVFMSSKGENLKKGEYSENPKSSKIFTYTETVLLESIPKELSAEALGKVAGANTSTTAMDGGIPIITDISAGPTPHFHTISMKHVHRIEPSYLYRVPSVVQFFQGSIDKLVDFFSI